MSLEERYLARIGVTRPVPVDPGGLARLQRAHLGSVPFENIDVRRGVPIRADLSAYLDKVVDQGRGGFCYELNGAFAWLLGRLGFDVRLWAANVFGEGQWGIDFDHMLCAVSFEETWIADVGFGDGFTRPLRLADGCEQAEPSGIYRLEERDGFWHLARRTPPEETFRFEYRFRPVDHPLEAFAPGLAYHQSAKSHFYQRTVVSMLTPRGRTTLRDDRLMITEDGERVVQPVESVAEWHRHLDERFGVQLPDPDFSP